MAPLKTLILLLALVIGLPSYGENDAPTLRVGMFTEFTPLCFIVSGEIQGIEVDLANQLGARLGRKIEIKTYAFTDLIPALEAGDVDIVMSGLSITPERKERVSFTAPYMEIGQMAIVHIENAAAFGKPDPLQQSGLKMGVQRGSTGEAYVSENYPRANVISYTGVESGLEALREKQIDVFVHDSTTSWQLGDSFVNDNLLSLNRFLTHESIAWAMRKDANDLLLAVNLSLENLKSEGKVNEILAKWLPGIPAVSNQSGNNTSSTNQ